MKAEVMAMTFWFFVIRKVEVHSVVREDKSLDVIIGRLQERYVISKLP